MYTTPSLHDLARGHAERLRREAMEDFWRDANSLLDRAGLTVAAQAERSARRWRTRLQHRLALRLTRPRLMA